MTSSLYIPASVAPAVREVWRDATDEDVEHVWTLTQEWTGSLSPRLPFVRHTARDAMREGERIEAARRSVEV